MRNRGVTFFTRIQGSCCCCCCRCCCRYCCCSCLPVLQGGFSSLSALGGVAHRRLGEPSRPAAAADAQNNKKKKVQRGPCVELPKAAWRGPISHLRLYAPKRRTFVDINLDFSFFFSLSLSLSPPIISFSVKGCTCYPLSGD